MLRADLREVCRGAARPADSSPQLPRSRRELPDRYGSPEVLWRRFASALCHYHRPDCGEGMALRVGGHLQVDVDDLDRQLKALDLAAPVSVRVSPRARRIGLRVDAAERKIE